MGGIFWAWADSILNFYSIFKRFDTKRSRNLKVFVAFQMNFSSLSFNFHYFFFFLSIWRKFSLISHEILQIKAKFILKPHSHVLLSRICLGHWLLSPTNSPNPFKRQMNRIKDASLPAINSIQLNPMKDKLTSYKGTEGKPIVENR